MKKKPGKSSRKTKDVLTKSRKETRKDIRLQKRLRRSRFNRKSMYDEQDVFKNRNVMESKKKASTLVNPQSAQSQAELERVNEQKAQAKLACDMEKSRKKLLLVANEEEDRNIRQLEKLLKLKKHKRKSLPKSFVEDGLSYLLDVCDSNSLKESVKAEQTLQDSGSDFEEDLALVTGNKERKIEKNAKSQDSDDDMGSQCFSGSDEKSDEDMEGGSDFSFGANADNYDSLSDRSDHMNDAYSLESAVSEDENFHIDKVQKSDLRNCNKGLKTKSKNGKSDQFEIGPSTKLTSNKPLDAKHLLNKKTKASSLASKTCSSNNDVKVVCGVNIDSEIDSDECGSSSDNETAIADKNPVGTWEDIYGRTRDKEGKIIDSNSSKYLPPALRLSNSENEDSKREKQLLRLKRQLKGLINRLAENNLASISTQIEELYMMHSRHDMNETLLQVVLEALISPVVTPERLVMEHVLLISVLHANVGVEVGAFFLQNIIKRFQESLNLNPSVEDKELDNLIFILSHMYNFKIFHASLMFDILCRVVEVLNEKRIELLLVVLGSVGFLLRKDDPTALKSLIIKLQSKAVNSTEGHSSRMKFMLDILLAIKNNNMSKIPSHNPEYTEHLRKLQRNLLRRGSYVTELKISLEDLLKVDERGRWWIVGSAWSGHLPGENASSNTPQSQSVVQPSGSMYSTQLLELARKQRMNTGIRKDIFCIMMTAEDYMDAFEKLLHLGLKSQQRQEIVHVLFHCCLQEKTYNLYYAHLAQKFCDFDRQYQMKFQYCLWDKLKELNKLTASQLSNMAQFLSHLFLEKGLPLSTLKVISFAAMEKACVRLVRQVLLAVLLSKDSAASEAVFHRVSASPKLHLFREGIRLFISHFVLRKSKKSLTEDEMNFLQDRVKAADRALTSAELKLEF